MKIYTDGSCFPNPNGYGGWAFVVVDNGSVLYSDYGGDAPTTNNRMELAAILEAMIWAGNRKCSIYSDSQYCVNVINEWYESWVRGKRLVGKANMDIIEKLMGVYYAGNFVVDWVRGHNGNDFNEMADDLANN